MKYVICCFCICWISLSSIPVMGQAGEKLGPFWQTYIDSLKRTPYPYTFPLLGKEARKKGFDIPLPVGIMLNTYFGSQQMNINDLSVGINDGEKVPLDFVKFGEVKANLTSVTVRPDLWVLPFLDVYGIAGATQIQTTVTVNVPVNFSTTANFSGSTFGVGTTVAGAIHGFVTIIDLNHTWTMIPEIDGAVQTTMFTPRVGRSFRFRKEPSKNVMIWVGAPGVFLNRGTSGSISLSSLKPEGELEVVQRIADESEAWYNDLSRAQQIVVKTIASGFADKMAGRDFTDVAIAYSLVKRPVSTWSMSVGGQYQISHQWQLRSEVGFLGGRKSLLLSGNYRFGW